jgi:DNA-binding HxlR family transcriptional regulator
MAERKTSSTNYRNQSFLKEQCPLNELLDLVSKRWFCEILFCIEEGNDRFRVIRDKLKYISDTILADRLKLLERYGFITRTGGDGALLKISYHITEKGIELSNLLDNMCQFSQTIPSQREESVIAAD